MEKIVLFLKILAAFQLCMFAYHVYAVYSYNKSVRGSKISAILGQREVPVSTLGIWLSIISTTFLLVF